MIARSIFLLVMLILCSSLSAASRSRHWHAYEADPDFKISVCYPTDLLHVHKNRRNEGGIDLAGADGAEVLFIARPDKYTNLKEQLSSSLEESRGGPRWVHESGPGLTPVHFYNIPRMRVTSSIVRDDSYLYIAESREEILVDWAIHVDHAIKSMQISYPKSHASAWRGVPERMRSCFKSLGPITNPSIR